MLWVAADVTWGVLDLTSSTPDLTLADIVYIASYPFALAAIVVGVRISWTRLARSLLDAAVIAVALGVGGWHALLAPLVHGAGWADVPSLAYPVLDIVTLFLLLTVVIAAESVIAPSVALIASSFAIVSVVDALYTYFVTIHGNERIGTLLDIGWEAQSLVFLLAVVVALRHDEDSAPRLGEPRDVGLLPLLGGAVALFVIAGFEIRAGEGFDAVALGVFALSALVARLLLTAHAKGELARELEAALMEQERLAISDALTGLHNRRFFDQSLDLEVARAQRADASLGLLMLDLDHFKWINDRYGHQAGDDVLVEVARRLEPVLRGGDLIARYGGEEFVVLLPDTRAGARPRGRRSAAAGRSARRPVRHAGRPAARDHHLGRRREPARARTRCRTSSSTSPTRRSTARRPTAATRCRSASSTSVELEVHSSSAHEFLQRLGDEIDRAQGRSELSRTISRWAELVAREMGLGSDAQRRCSVAARFHDIGKIAVPASILRKRAELAPQEWELVRQHPEHGARLVGLVPEFRDVAPLIRDHHERPDGLGYPAGKAGERHLARGRDHLRLRRLGGDAHAARVQAGALARVRSRGAPPLPGQPVRRRRRGRVPRHRGRPAGDRAGRPDAALSVEDLNQV